MNEQEIKDFLREHLQVEVVPESPYESCNNVKIGLKIAGDKDCFAYDWVYIPVDH
jgi:hypothetical protein